MDQAVEEKPKVMQVAQPSIREAWEMASSQLRLEMQTGLYASWVQPLQPLGYSEGVFRLGAMNRYARDWVVSHLNSRLNRLLAGIYQQPVRVSIVLWNGEPEHIAAQQDMPHPSINGSAQPPTPLPAQPAAPVDHAPAHTNGRSNGTPAVEAPAAPQRGAKKRVVVPVSTAAAPAGEAAPDTPDTLEGASPRKIRLQRAYGVERARVIQPERGMFMTMYFFHKWLPLLGQSALTTIIAARSLCFWNPMTGELRDVVETDMSELASRAAVSVRTVKDVLNQPLVKQYFLRYKVRRVMTTNGVRTAGIVLQVRMDDPLTPEDQETHHLVEEERWYTAAFEDEDE